MTDPHFNPPGALLTINRLSEGGPHNGFSFLTNVLGLADAPELELIPGFTLRKAVTEEIVIIKGILVENNCVIGGRYFFPWETGRTDVGFDTAPEPDWRYYVISFSGSNVGISLLEKAFALLERGPRVGFTVTQSGQLRALSLHVGRLFRDSQENKTALSMNCPELYTLVLDKADASMISKLTRRLLEQPPNGVDVSRVAQKMLDLRSLDVDTDMAFLGYFTILESLLVHKPDPKDPTDSITRQVKKKVALLDNRWLPKIDYSTFSGIRPEGVWGKMYELRSVLAHGDVPNFKGSLKSLGDFRNAQSLLISTVRSIARYALDEPQLVLDLREC